MHWEKLHYPTIVQCDYYIWLKIVYIESTKLTWITIQGSIMKHDSQRENERDISSTEELFLIRLFLKNFNVHIIF